MPVPLLLAIPAIISAVTALYKAGSGIAQSSSGNKKLKELEGNMPSYEIDQSIVDNKNMAAQLASQGFGDATKNYYGDVIERGLGSTIQAGLQTGQGLEGITNAFGSANDAFRSFLLQDALQKIENQKILMDANRDLRDENIRAFDYNENIPWQLKYNRATQKTNAGMQNTYSGGKDTASSLMLLSDTLGNGSGGGGDKYSGGGGDSGWLQYMLKNYGG